MFPIVSTIFHAKTAREQGCNVPEERIVGKPLRNLSALSFSAVIKLSRRDNMWVDFSIIDGTRSGGTLRGLYFAILKQERIVKPSDNLSKNPREG